MSTHRWVLALFTVLGVVAGFPPQLYAQESVVTVSELREAVKRSASQRERNIAEIRSFLEHPGIRRIVVGPRVDAGRIEGAVAELRDEELARLADRIAGIRRDFAGGVDEGDRILLVFGTIFAALPLIALAF